jgi:hypothetical protein
VAPTVPLAPSETSVWLFVREVRAASRSTLALASLDRKMPPLGTACALSESLGPCGVYQHRFRVFYYFFVPAVACLRGCATPLGVLELRFGAERVQLLLRQGVAVVFGSPLTYSVNGYSH